MSVGLLQKEVEGWVGLSVRACMRVIHPQFLYNSYHWQVLKLLKKAWQRRLIFTIGMSSTTGEEDTVVWNEIHHKTEAFSNHMGHGFPDPNYLDNVLSELAAQGVEDDG